MQEEAKGKFSPNYQGPFIITKVLPGGAVILSEMDGLEFSLHLNTDILNLYYV